MDNDKDIEIKREEDLGLDEKIKAGAKAVGRKIGDPESDIASEYDTEKTIERVEDWENIKLNRQMNIYQFDRYIKRVRGRYTPVIAVYSIIKSTNQLTKRHKIV